jgi:hypothetical protein
MPPGNCTPSTARIPRIRIDAKTPGTCSSMASRLTVAPIPTRRICLKVALWRPSLPRRAVENTSLAQSSSIWTPPYVYSLRSEVCVQSRLVPGTSAWYQTMTVYRALTSYCAVRQSLTEAAYRRDPDRCLPPAVPPRAVDQRQGRCSQRIGKC